MSEESPLVDWTRQNHVRRKRDVRVGVDVSGQRANSVWWTSGTLPQCPPLAAVIVTHPGLSGKVHHVVLFTGAAEGRKTVKEGGKEEECEHL